jgi:hypothetical protein
MSNIAISVRFWKDVAQSSISFVNATATFQDTSRTSISVDGLQITKAGGVVLAYTVLDEHTVDARVIGSYAGPSSSTFDVEIPFPVAWNISFISRSGSASLQDLFGDVTPKLSNLDCDLTTTIPLSGLPAALSTNVVIAQPISELRIQLQSTSFLRFEVQVRLAGLSDVVLSYPSATLQSSTGLLTMAYYVDGVNAVSVNGE